MPLILVIEPDRRQTTKLSMLARNQLHAELLLADTVEQALATLDDHDPDLILTSPLLSAHDHAKLSARLRELANDGLRVPTLAIPTFAVPGQRARTPPKSAMRARGARGRTTAADGIDARSRTTAGNGIDPVAFGMLVSAHLDRAAADRAAAGPVLHARRPAPPPVVDEEAEYDEVEEQEPVEYEPVEHQEPVEVRAERTETWDNADWGDVLSAMRREIDSVKREPRALVESAPPDFSHLADRLAEDLSSAATVVEAESAPVEAAALPAAITASAAVVAANVQPLTAAATPTVDSPATPAPNRPDSQARAKRVRRVPAQDAFGIFDPNQCGFSALFAKVNAINENGTRPAKKPA